MTGMIKGVITWPVRKALGYIYLIGALGSAGAGMLAGTQYPKFMQTYEQRLGGRVEVIKERCQDYQNEADERTGGDLEKLLKLYRSEKSTYSVQRAIKDLQSCSGGTSDDIRSILQRENALEKGVGFLTYNVKAFGKDLLDESYDFEKKDYKGVNLPKLTSPQITTLQNVWKNYKVGFPDLNEPGLLWYTGAGAVVGLGLYSLGISFLKKLFSGIIKKKEETASKGDKKKKPGKQKVGKADLYKRLDNL